MNMQMLVRIGLLCIIFIYFESFVVEHIPKKSENFIKGTFALVH